MLMRNGTLLTSSPLTGGHGLEDGHSTDLFEAYITSRRAIALLPLPSYLTW